ncbi:MAG: response regulator [Actinomycetota bacterium]
MPEARRRALLVEDEPADQTLIVSAFERIGSQITIDVVATVAEAQQALQAETLPVLCLVDLRLRGESGLDLIAWARRDERARLTPFVVLSGSDDRTVVRQAYDAGANAYLVKPQNLADIDELARRIDAFWLGACALADDPR